jgi:endonuclease IV
MKILFRNILTLEVLQLADMSLGIHVAKSSKIRKATYKDMSHAVEAEVHLLGLSACQIFTHGPRNYKKNNMNFASIKKFCTEEKIDISTHGTYVSTSIWKINQKNKGSDESRKNIEHIQDMLLAAKQCGGSGLVIHLPKKSPTSIVETLEVLSENKELVELTKEHIYLILEMPASKPDDKTYETPAKLNQLCDLIQSGNVKLEWRLCIDTAHQWSCGIKMNGLNAWSNWIEELNEAVSDKIKIIHLNGNSTSNFGKGKDVHEIVMSPSDGIWGSLISEKMTEFISTDGKLVCKNNDDFYGYLSSAELAKIKKSSLCEIARYAAAKNIALILEVNRGEFIYTKFAVDIIKNLMTDDNQ